ncbi:MAG TPA: pyruvate kinase [Patescibacteria group bacterium]|nr:pyruvate kinase [Patescibacteria group bacterium]
MRTKKRTKIVCTIGPSCREVSVLTAMVRAGMNVARFNFSHGTYQDHARLFRHVRRAARQEGEPVTLLQDLQGPKIRVGVLPPEGVPFVSGHEIVFDARARSFIPGDVPILPVTYKGLHRDVKAGQRILLDDGLLEAHILGVSGSRVRMRVVSGGVLLSHKGMNFPDSFLRLSSLTPKDFQDAHFGLEQGVDWMALSFVTSARDVRRLRSFVRRTGKRGTVLPRILVKIEKHEAIERFDEILEAADGIMVARGDLGVEIPAEEVPIRQKEIIQRCLQVGKPVIVATQMLDSMTRNPRPTRAEVSDVANAAIDHADAVMLSAETATGAYPVKVVETMARILARTEASPYDDLPSCFFQGGEIDSTRHQAFQSLRAQRRLDGVVSASWFAAWKESLNVCRFEMPFFVAAENPSIVRQLNVRWGVCPFFLKRTEADVFEKRAVAELKKLGVVRSGMRLAIVDDRILGVGFDFLKVK